MGHGLTGSSWSKAIPILMNAGHKVIAVQLPHHSLVGDVETIKRAIEYIGGSKLVFITFDTI
jgi:hypothetical protein